MSRRPSARAFTLVELLVVIGIIALLISILLPALGRAKEQARTVTCASNLRQVSTAMLLYINDNKGVLPYCYVNGGVDNSQYTWFTLLVGLNYLGAPQQDGAVNDDPVAATTGNSALMCPSTGTGVFSFPPWAGATDDYGTEFNRRAWRFSDSTDYSNKPNPLVVDTSYGINSMQSDWTNSSAACVFITRYKTSQPALKYRRLGQIRRTTELVMLYDGDGFKALGTAACISARHSGGRLTNFSFFDTHVETMDPRFLSPPLTSWVLSRTGRSQSPLWRLQDATGN